MKPWAVLEYPSHAASSYVAIEFGITGPALSVSSNCCTGIDAIHTAASYIEAGKARVAVAGGCDAPLFPLSFAGFCALARSRLGRLNRTEPLVHTILCETVSF